MKPGHGIGNKEKRKQAYILAAIVLSAQSRRTATKGRDAAWSAASQSRYANVMNEVHGRKRDRDEKTENT